MATGRINLLFYITHINNLPSILEKGILSHAKVVEENLEYTPIYAEDIVTGRESKTTPNGKSLWSFANLYFKARNPMLYRVICEKNVNEIAIIGVGPGILNRDDIFITTGNAASYNTEILTAKEGKKIIPNIRKIINIEFWNLEDGSKRKIMAECLIPDAVPPRYVQTIYVSDHETSKKVKSLVSRIDIPVVVEPDMFFQPSRVTDITPNLSVVEGDMFFSRLQTLTVSVNCVGKMGKGLASRAKFQFPDVYVRYESLCRKKILQMGKPYLYKRETSSDSELADEPFTLRTYNSDTWFLLFPTKNHWRERADFEGIKTGLIWVKENYLKEGVKSLAMPALGCGLGGLEWPEVGPLMVKNLKELIIPVRVYLPTDKKINDDQVTRDFLLGS